MTDFPRALAIVRRSECHPACVNGDHSRCFTDDPDDPGGATCCGIIERTYHEYRKGKGLPLLPVRQHSWEEHADIYRERYWATAHCAELRWPLSLIHFDAAVNCGVKRAVEMLQRALRVPDDGAWGPQTFNAAATVSVPFAAYRYLLERVIYYDRLDEQNPRLTKFLTGGWLGRIRHLYAIL